MVDDKEDKEQDSETDIGWYVSDIHCRRAIGYLSASLAHGGFVNRSFNSPLLLEMWGEALSQTMEVNDPLPSPIGPDLERAEEILRGG